MSQYEDLLEIEQHDIVCFDLIPWAVPQIY